VVQELPSLQGTIVFVPLSQVCKLPAQGMQIAPVAVNIVWTSFVVQVLPSSQETTVVGPVEHSKSTPIHGIQMDPSQSRMVCISFTVAAFPSSQGITEVLPLLQLRLMPVHGMHTTLLSQLSTTATSSMVHGLPSSQGKVVVV
jgi:hypothetical protein